MQKTVRLATSYQQLINCMSAFVLHVMR